MCVPLRTRDRDNSHVNGARLVSGHLLAGFLMYWARYSILRTCNLCFFSECIYPISGDNNYEKNVDIIIMSSRLLSKNLKIKTYKRECYHLIIFLERT